MAAPIVLRIGHVPVFALPFYYKSLKSGRQSGILFPSFDFGWSSREGRYIRDFGYYWATNEYMDFLVEGDYNENRDFGFRVQNRYVKRYAFNGGIDYSHKEGLGDGTTTRRMAVPLESQPAHPVRRLPVPRRREDGLDEPDQQRPERYPATGTSSAGS